MLRRLPRTTRAGLRRDGRDADRDGSRSLGFRGEPWRTASAAAERAVVLDRERERSGPRGRDLVVASGRPLLALRDRRRFPARPYEAGAVEPAEDRVHGPTRKRGAVHDVEAVADATGDRLEHGHGGGGEQVGG